MNNPFKQIDPINLNRKNSQKWVEGSCDLTGDYSSGVETGFLSLSLSSKKILYFFAVIFVAIGVLLVKSFWLQIVSGNQYYALAENNRIQVDYNKAHRGVFFDRNGKTLVNNLFGFSVFILPADLPKDVDQKESELRELASIIGMPYEEIALRLVGSEKRFFQPILLGTGVPYDQAMTIKIKAEELPGVELNVDAWRLYPYGESLSHLLGYIGKIDSAEYQDLSNEYLFNDNIGKAGLEKYYESYVKGIHGQERIEVDALGRKKKVISQSQPVAGSNVILSIDIDLQKKVYSVFKERLPEGKGAAIITNCSNGEILAMVDYPSYDNNLFTGGISHTDYNALMTDERNPLFSRAIFGEYPSGSTIKPVMSAGALQENIITYNTTVNSVGGIYVGQWFFPDWKAGGHGVTNVTKAIAQSVNTFFYYIGGGYGDFKGMGIDLIIKYFKVFGLGQVTGIDLPGERDGFVPDPQWKEDTRNEVWYIGDTYHVSIGQGDLLVTPLQVNNFIMAVANGGHLLTPHLAIASVDANGQKIPFNFQSIRDVGVSAENLKIVRMGMRETVTSGSAQSLNYLPVEVAGKTGTAQWHKDKPNHAWFTGFAPYNNPNFCITILVEEGGEGSSTSVPVAREILQWWFSQPR
jgi:penicillin-binding protein 2